MTAPSSGMVMSSGIVVLRAHVEAQRRPVPAQAAYGLPGRPVGGPECEHRPRRPSQAAIRLFVHDPDLAQGPRRAPMRPEPGSCGGRILAKKEDAVGHRDEAVQVEGAASRLRPQRPRPARAGRRPPRAVRAPAAAPRSRPRPWVRAAALPRGRDRDATGWRRCRARPGGTARRRWPGRSRSGCCAASRGRPGRTPLAIPLPCPGRALSRRALGDRGEAPAFVSEVEQAGRVVGGDARPPAIAAHGGQIGVPRVLHHLLIRGTRQIGLGDEAGAQPVRRQPLARMHRSAWPARPAAAGSCARRRR